MLQDFKADVAKSVVYSKEDHEKDLNGLKIWHQIRLHALRKS